VLGRTGSFSLGCILIVVSLGLSYLLTPSTATWIYVFSAILGVGNSIIMVTSVCLEGDLIGSNIESGAFVYGAMSFTDKISNGIAILLIQNEREKLQNAPAEDAEFLRQVYCILPSITAVVGLLTVMYMGYCSATTKRRNLTSSSSDEIKTQLLAEDDRREVYGSA
jgi:Na+/melibiose symporter-like transporter